MRCAMSGQKINDSSEGVWDDGEWISWNWINDQIYEQGLKIEYPLANPELIELYQRFLDVAIDHKSLTGNYLQVWGELGELYAEIKFGIKRHRPMTQGSDGKLGNHFVEIKTISPEKSAHKVQVKRSGNFNKLLVVKISESFEFEAKMINRRELTKGDGKHASISWQSIPDTKK
jgi:hypothetical protein